MNTRRDFIKKTAIGAAGITLGGLSAKSYGRVLGANDRINFGVAGINSRGIALMHAISDAKNASIGAVCDADRRIIEKSIKKGKDLTGLVPKGYEDVREMLEQKDIDAIAIATPDHWHAPMTIMGVQAGKHVYVEKPCSHNPHEGELLVEAEKKYGKVIQMGNQQRSASTSIQAIKDIRNGIIGDVYMGKAWYANNRGPIGNGKKVAIPEWLNWELWQGPAPRKDYQDIWVHYNWHWFWHWGTGEINNNGTHEIDICRWALDVQNPTKVSSSGGRYHYNDDWEFYDTQIVNYEFGNDKLISWEGRSCNDFQMYERGRGATLHGTKGTILLDRNNYMAYDNDNKLIKENKEEQKSATTNTQGRGFLDIVHMNNMLDAIRMGTKQNSPIDEGATSNLLCHLGNIAQKTGRSLEIDKKTGRILNNKEAMKMWGREYEPGWEPKI